MVLAGKGELGIFEEAVEEDEEHVEAGGEGDQGFLAAGQELLVVGFEDPVVADGAEGAQVEGAADGAPATG